MSKASSLNRSRIAKLFASYGDRYHWQSAVRIGEGGFGAVWKVNDTWLDHDVAVKISNQPLVDEVRMCREIDGQTVRIYDYLRGTDDWNGFAMELLDRHWRPMDTHIESRTYSEHDIQHYFDSFEILRDTLSGLAQIHGKAYQRTKRFVHADIKPQNLIIGIQPKKSATSVFRMTRSTPIVKIIDLGVAAGHGDHPRGHTPSYAFPGSGHARPGLDLYSLGLTFVEMLTGDLPDHEAVKHKTRIRGEINKLSSGSHYIDTLATEITRRCVRAATQPTNCRALLDQLDDELFLLDAPYLLALRSICQYADAGLRKSELSDLIFDDMAPHYGWQKNRTRLRMETLEELITEMYKRDMLVREGQRYFPR